MHEREVLETRCDSGTGWRFRHAHSCSAIVANALIFRGHFVKPHISAKSSDIQKIKFRSRLGEIATS
jgi:hypothetical protein